jgi:hypothetical protein
MVIEISKRGVRDLNPWSAFPQARDDTSLFVKALSFSAVGPALESAQILCSSPESSPVLEKYWRRF